MASPLHLSYRETHLWFLLVLVWFHSFTFRSLIYLKSILVYGMKRNLILSFFFQSFQHHLLKSPSLSLRFGISPLSYTSKLSQFLYLLFYSIGLSVYSCAGTILLHFWRLQVLYLVVISPHKLSIFTIFLAVLLCLFSHMNFNINLSSLRKTAWYFYLGCIKLCYLENTK